MTPSSNSATSAALLRQDGVLTTAQALSCVSRGKLRAELQGRRWQRPTRGVIVTHNGQLSDTQRAWVALLGCADGSALAGLTALTVDGFEGFSLPAGKQQVVLPEGAWAPAYPLAVPHWSTMLGPEDVHPLKIPRRTRPPRSLVDEAAWSTAPRRGRAVILAGVQQGLVRPSDLRDALGRRGPCRHRALIKESILDADGGVHSLPERDFDMIRRAFHLPRPSRQHVVERVDGRYFLDIGWEDLDAGVEIHGIPHLAVLQWDRDLFRANEIAILGPRLLSFSSYAVRHQADLVGTQTTRLLHRQGWRG